MREANTCRHQKRWFDGHSPQAHVRDGLHLLARLTLLAASTGCF